MPLVGLGPVLNGQPLRVGGDVGQGFVGHRMHRLAQQLPALLHLVGGHVVQPGVIRVLRVGLLEPRVELREDRVLRPGFAGAGGAGELHEPQFQPLVPGSPHSNRCSAVVPVRGRPVTKIGAAIRRRRVGVLLPGDLAEQSGRPGHCAGRTGTSSAEFGEIGVAAVGLQQDRQRLDVVVLIGAEVVESDRFDRRCLEVFDGADVGAGGFTISGPRSCFVLPSH